ncbi:hypothetical protein PAXRUDRAFT_831340 [Paxillus rubicundulus Ve08.2h10]|uniref:Uncharacterized protein n=1 Tax=Paxillus rubicundulus Ve08.2h10 TaxID=930991 RepID=A0A0D0DII5_9AGAM|nr:hypothetical protein PAXRUDRAFT_831340 [Paxillus rubicundulus Ve08.2h10]
MVGDPVSFTGDTRYEVITVLANCGSDTVRAREALVVWISRKQSKGRSTEHILNKLCDIESKFIKDTSLHSAFREARAMTLLPRTPCIPLPDFIVKENSQSETWSAPIDVTPTVHSPGAGSRTSSPGGSSPIFIPSTSPSTSSSAHSPLRSAQNLDNVSAGPSTVPNPIPWWAREPPLSPIAGSPPLPSVHALSSPRPVANVGLPSSPEGTPRAQGAIRQFSQSPLKRRYTVPDRGSAPHLPLPPLPAGDQSPDAHGRLSLGSSHTRHSSSSVPSPTVPITPTSPGLYRRSPSSAPSLISRDSEGSDFTDRISTRSFPRYWQMVNPDPYPSNDVIRVDSPLMPGTHTPNSAKENKSAGQSIKGVRG